MSYHGYRDFTEDDVGKIFTVRSKEAIRSSCYRIRNSFEKQMESLCGTKLKISRVNSPSNAECIDPGNGWVWSPEMFEETHEGYSKRDTYAVDIEDDLTEFAKALKEANYRIAYGGPDKDIRHFKLNLMQISDMLKVRQDL